VLLRGVKALLFALELFALRLGLLEIVKGGSDGGRREWRGRVDDDAGMMS